MVGRKRGRRDAAMDEGARRWMLRYAHRNLWRVPSWCDLDDLIADGAMCWQIMVRKYPKVRERRHLMGLFTRIFSNHVHKLANKRSVQVEECQVEPDIVANAQACADSEMVHFAYQAPQQVRKLLLAILAQPELTARATRRTPFSRRPTTNEWLCQLAGLDPQECDLRSQLNTYLGRRNSQDM